VTAYAETGTSTAVSLQTRLVWDDITVPCVLLYTGEKPICLPADQQFKYISNDALNIFWDFPRAAAVRHYTVKLLQRTWNNGTHTDTLVGQSYTILHRTDFVFPGA
jgi:hypothetical protein